jgi:hypothetical protein
VHIDFAYRLCRVFGNYFVNIFVLGKFQSEIMNLGRSQAHSIDKRSKIGSLSRLRLSRHKLPTIICGLIAEGSDGIYNEVFQSNNVR